MIEIILIDDLNYDDRQYVIFLEEVMFLNRVQSKEGYWYENLLFKYTLQNI